eukprot:304856_1
MPLRLRLQNRGHLKIINDVFYHNVAKDMYTFIVKEIKQAVSCYDPKKVRSIENKCLASDSITSAWANHIGLDVDSDNSKKVLKELCHAIVSRLMRTTIKRKKLISILQGFDKA